MKNYLLTEGDVNYIMNMQRELNAAYHGSDWINKLNAQELFACAQFELCAEFMREIEGMWKFFGNCKIDREKALFELVDFASFFCSGISTFHQGGVKLRSVMMRLQVSTDRKQVLAVTNQLHNLSRGVETHNADGLAEVVLDTVHYGLSLIDVSAEEFMIAYNKKAALNFHRAENGAVAGTYDKSNEPPLFVGLLPPSEEWLSAWGSQNV